MLNPSAHLHCTERTLEERVQVSVAWFRHLHSLALPARASVRAVQVYAAPRILNQPLPQSDISTLTIKSRPGPIHRTQPQILAALIAIGLTHGPARSWAV